MDNTENVNEQALNFLIYKIPSDCAVWGQDVVDAAGMSSLFHADDLTATYQRHAGAGHWLAADRRWLKGRPLVLRKGAEGKKSDDGGYEVFRYLDAPVSALTLLRETAIRGYVYPLADGQVWEIPIARAIQSDGVPQSVLPAWMDRVDGRWVRGRPKAGYETLETIASEFWDTFWPLALADIANHEKKEAEKKKDEPKDPGRVWSGNGRVTVEGLDETDLATQILACNYRIGPAEAALLQLFDTEQTGYVVIYKCCDAFTAIDYAIETIEAAKKKLPSAVECQPQGDYVMSVGAQA